jgi:hypothetical protein
MSFEIIEKFSDDVRTVSVWQADSLGEMATALDPQFGQLY